MKQHLEASKEMCLALTQALANQTEFFSSLWFALWIWS